MRIAFTIHGEPASLKNSRQIVHFGDRPASIKSKKARAYEQLALCQIPAMARQMICTPVRVTMRIFYASERPDLDEAAILDILQAKKVRGVVVREGVYVNDRQVREKHIWKGIDKKDPRAEIVVETLDEKS